MWKKILLALVIPELILIIFLSMTIYNNKRNILGVAKIAPIEQKYINTGSVYGYKYFYEPKPHIVMDSINDWVPYKGIYTINADTLNERYDYQTEKPPNTLRIVTLGDSYTFGLYVDTKYNWTEQLEDKLNQKNCNNIHKFEVINLGMQGYDISYSALRYKLRGAKYNPDLVIWLVKSDDYFQINEVVLEKEQRYTKQMKASGEFDRLVKSGIMYPSMVKAMEDTKRELGMERIEQLQKEYFDTFFDLYKNPLILMSFKGLDKDSRGFYKKVIADNPKGYFYDEFDLLSKKEYSFLNDGHPTQEGHKAIAEDIYRYLINNKIISCE